MAHPFQDHKQHKVERSRVASMTRGYATGGAVSPGPGATAKKKAVLQRDAQAVEGGSAKERQDRPGRARGGRAPKGKGTNVNVIIAPQGAAGAAPPMIPPGVAGPGAGPPPPMPMRPPLPPPMAGGPGPGMPPPGMPPRSHGGRTYATGGAVNAGSSVFNAGRKAGTQVQNNPSGKNDQKDVGRGRVITYKTGGRVKRDSGGAVSGGSAISDRDQQNEANALGQKSSPYNQPAAGGPNDQKGQTAEQQLKRNDALFGSQKGYQKGYKTGGAVISAAKGQMGPKLDGGAGGGTARLEKETRAAKNYKRA